MNGVPAPQALSNPWIHSFVKTELLKKTSINAIRKKLKKNFDVFIDEHSFRAYIKSRHYDLRSNEERAKTYQKEYLPDE